jgi:DNA-binding SARP family transcriptional activator/tetratricopeptide (TPR) repeat protein
MNLGGPRQETVMAMLLLEASHVISTERLITAVWDEDPPTTARVQIQICVSALRRVLLTDGGHQRIASRRPGYVFRLNGDTLDSLMFEARVATARQARLAGEMTSACDEFRSALSLWRGTVLAGLGSGLVEHSAARLNERRLLILEECVECELQVGKHQELVGELKGLVAEHPLRERPWAFLMAALYGAGRQADALETYRRARSILIDELGIEPGKELQDLHQAILHGVSMTSLTPEPTALMRRASATSQDRAAVPMLLPAAIPDFTGRRRLVGGLIAAIMQAAAAEKRSNAVPVNVITGPGGIGKTTLAVHVAHQLASKFPDGQLFARLRIGDRQADPSDILERFLRILGVSAAALPEGIEERAEIFRNVLATRRILIVLDDVMAEHQIEALLPGSALCSVIVTSRKRLTGLSAANRFRVDVFSPDSAARMLARIVGQDRIDAEPEAVAALCKLCGYLPMALRIVAARLAARPHWSVTDLVDRLLDESRVLDELNHGTMGVRASISLTYESLSADARRLFRKLALIDAPTFASWVGSPLLETSVAAAGELLEELAEAYLIDVEPGHASGQNRYRFHDIMRPFARERLAAEESAEARHQALEHLLGALLYLAGEAHRREYAGDFLTRHSGASRWPLPESLVGQLLEDPLAWYEQERLAIVSAVRQGAAVGLVQHSWDLALSAVPLFESHANFADWRTTHETALKASCRAGDRWGEAAMRYSLGSLYLFEQRNEQAARQLALSDALYQELGDRHGVALVQRNRAYLDRINGNLELALTRWEEALGTLQVVGDRIAEAHVLHNMAQVHLDFGHDEPAMELLARAERICSDYGNRRVGAQVTHRFGELYLRREELDLARDAYQRVLLAVRETGDQVGECYALLGLGTVQLRSGAPQDAAGMLATAQEIADTVGEPMVQSRVMLARAEVALNLGQLGDATELAIRAERAFEEMNAAVLRAQALLVLGQIRLAHGEPQGALAAWQSGTASLVNLNLHAAVSLAHDIQRRISDLGGQPGRPRP